MNKLKPIIFFGLLSVFFLYSVGKNDVEAAQTGDRSVPDAPFSAGLPVIVTESHHHVLPYWFAAAEKNRIPRSGVTVIHLDAHPDLAMPPGHIPQQWPDHPHAFQNAVDIASFQPAAVYAGLVQRVIWMKPSWALQIDEGQYAGKIGQDKEGFLKTDISLYYYISEQGWTETGRLIEPTPFTIEVMEINKAGDTLKVGDVVTILDIDLDTFSTTNPGAISLRENGISQKDINRLKEIFDVESFFFSSDPHKQAKQNSEVEKAVTKALTGGVLAKIKNAFTLLRYGIGPFDMYFMVKLINKLPDGYSPAAAIEDAKSMLGTPEKFAGQEEIGRTLEAIDRLLKNKAIRPALVTITRSDTDGFTPKDLTAHVESRVLKILRDNFPQAVIHYDSNLKPFN